jgi:hypothetical protein
MAGSETVKLSSMTPTDDGVTANMTDSITVEPPTSEIMAYFEGQIAYAFEHQEMVEVDPANLKALIHYARRSLTADASPAQPGGERTPLGQALWQIARLRIDGDMALIDAAEIARSMGRADIAIKINQLSRPSLQGDAGDRKAQYSEASGQWHYGAGGRPASPDIAGDVARVKERLASRQRHGPMRSDLQFEAAILNLIEQMERDKAQGIAMINEMASQLARSKAG